MKIGYIDYFLDEWHANQYLGWIAKASDGEMNVAYAYALIDSPKPGGRTTEAWCREMGVERCASIEEIVARSDALIVLSPDNAEMHEQLCQLPLRSGKPTFVDKTFAPDADTARRLFTLAEQSGTPCYTSSALRYAEEYQGIDCAAIRALASWGPGTYESYAIHQLEPVVMLLDAPVARVLALTGEGCYTLLLALRDGRQASVTAYEEGSPFMMNICAQGANAAVEARSDFFAVFIRELADFFRTGRGGVPHAQTMAIMELFSAGKKALEVPGIWVELPQ